MKKIVVFSLIFIIAFFTLSYSKYSYEKYPYKKYGVYQSFKKFVNHPDYDCYGEPNKYHWYHKCRFCSNIYVSQKWGSENKFYNNAGGCPNGKYGYCDDLNLGPIDPCGCTDRLKIGL